MKGYQQYIEDVLTGEISVGEKIKLAVLRHVNDLKSSKKKIMYIILTKKWQISI
jgi:hypothetical protein